MPWYWVVVITLAAYWTIGCLLTQFNNDDILFYWAMGLLYPVLYVIFYPIRAWKTYSYSKAYYQKNGITRMQYMFGKRVLKKSLFD